MANTLENLLEAHVRHELNRFKAKPLQKAIREETAAFFQWIKTITLREIITPEEVAAIIERNAVDLPIPAEVRELAGEMSRRVLSSPHNDTTTLEAIIPRKPYDDMVEKIGSQEKYRQDFIRHMVNSAAYSQQVSEVLFTGIKEYLLTENIFAQKVPGLASLIKIGKFAVNKTMHPLEVAVEKTVKNYIEKSLGNTIRRSEKSLNAYFDRDRIAEIGDDIWASVSKRKLSEYFTVVDPDDVADVIDIGFDFWLHFRKTPYFKAIYTDLVHFFFEKHGNRTLDLVARDMGVTEKQVTAELLKTLPRGIKKALDSGYLEARIRARLAHFYLSPETAQLLSIETKVSRTAQAAKKPAKKPAAEKKPAGKSRK